jgi:V-type H+-transporting ATPase subunit B
LLNRINPKIIAEFYQRRPTKRATQAGAGQEERERERDEPKKDQSEGKLIDA